MELEFFSHFYLCTNSIQPTYSNAFTKKCMADSECFDYYSSIAYAIKTYRKLQIYNVEVKNETNFCSFVGHNLC